MLSMFAFSSSNSLSPSLQFIEAPEDDDDFTEEHENENPEAVQAMIGAELPSWVFPDLVRVLSSSVNIDALEQLQQTSPPATSDLTASTRNSQPRILDPPDVSLLSSAASANLQQQPNTIDLCNSVLQSSKLQNFSNNGNNSSPSNSGSSSGASSLSTNLSSSSTSNNKTTKCKTLSNYNFPSTSSATFTGGQKQPSSTLERRVRALEEEKEHLRQQLLRKDEEIEEMRQGMSSPKTASSAPAAVIRQIGDLFEQMNGNLQNTLTAFERRIESLESRHQFSNAISNGSSNETSLADSSNPQLTQLMIEYQRRVSILFCYSY